MDVVTNLVAALSERVRPATMKNFLGYSLQRLGTDYVDIYRPARLDPHVPVEETVGAIAEMIHAGYVRWIGLSEVGAETIRRAHARVGVQFHVRAYWCWRR